jgi:hypothetical protein
LQTLGAVPTPFEQEPAAQEVSAPGYVHESALTPSQRPPHGVVPVQPARGARGMPLIARHVPAFDGSLQASHFPLHALSQHTLSTQKPDVHSFAAPQFSPRPFCSAHVSALVQ